MPAIAPFPADALEANRQGQLTPDQRQRLAGLARADRKSEFTGSFVFVAMGLLVLFGVDSSKPPLLHYGVPAACFLVAGFFVFRATSAGDALTRDLRSVHVEQVDGALRKWRDANSTTMSFYSLEVERQRFHISNEEYEALPNAGIVRVFYLPKSRMVVNVELLPDRPLAPGALESPVGIIKTALTGIFSADPVKGAEARATLQAIENAEKASMSEVASAPAVPGGAADPRPLAQAIVGSWQMGPMRVTFHSDGSLSMALPFGQTRSGHWSVDAAGKLHSDVLGGKDEAAEARVAGDSLTVSMDGETMTAHRISG